MDIHPETVGNLARINDSKYIDSFKLPTVFDNQIDSYKEWQHFNVFDNKTGLFALINYVVSGNIYNINKGIVAKVALIRDPKGLIYSAIEPHNTKELNISYLGPNIQFNGASITYNNYSYRVSLIMDTIPIKADLDFKIASQPLTSMTKPFGSGFLGWTAFCKMKVNGSITIADTIYTIKNSYGYHDHDWGRYSWGEKVGWEWGIFGDDDPSGITILFDRRTDGIRGNIRDKVLLVYKGSYLKVNIQDNNLNVNLQGRFEGKKIVVPGLMGILHPEKGSSLPKKIIIKGFTSTKEMIRIEYTPEVIIQFILPNFKGKGESQINEMLGKIKIEHSLSEIKLSTNMRGCMEMVGPFP